MPHAGATVVARSLRGRHPAGHARARGDVGGRVLPVARGDRRQEVPRATSPTPTPTSSSSRASWAAAATGGGRASEPAGRRGRAAGADGGAQLGDSRERARQAPAAPPVVTVYPQPRRRSMSFRTWSVKAAFSEPVTNVNAGTFTLIGCRRRARARLRSPDRRWHLGPLSRPGLPESRRHLHGAPGRGICGDARQLHDQGVAWSYRVASQREAGAGDTTIPLGFRTGLWPLPGRPVPTAATTTHP